MILRAPQAIGFTAFSLMSACGGSDADPNGPAGTGGVAAPYGADSGVAEVASAITLAGEMSGLKTGDVRTLTVMATFGAAPGADERDVTSEATFVSSHPEIVAGDGGRLTAVSEGSADITATYAGLTATSIFEVTAPLPQALTIMGDMELTRGEPEALTVLAVFENGTERDVTAEVEWQSDNADVASVGEDGLASGHYGGQARLTATWAGLSSTLDVTVGCDYPRFANQIRYGAIMPPLFWEDAYQPDGSRFDFRLDEVYCNVEYKDTKVVFIIVSAGWCAPCKLYAKRLAPQAAAIEAAGSLIAIMEAQTADYGPASNAYAQRHLDHIIGDSFAIRLGDHDTQPRPDWLSAQPIVAGFPTTIAVRTRDMKVITDSNRSNYYLPLLRIAEDPEADWSNPGIPPFDNKCEEGDEEASEPNDTLGTAAPLLPGSVRGGICTDAPDFYEITLDGPWAAQLDFDGSSADLDIFVWDRGTNQPMQVNGDVVGSAGTGDREAFEWQGPAMIGVVGYKGASASYDLNLEAR